MITRRNENHARVHDLPDEGFSGEQELEQEAHAAAVIRRAGIQAVEARSTGTLSAIQTGAACKDRDAEAEVKALKRTPGAAHATPKE